jgi:hypothetical protein
MGVHVRPTLRTFAPTARKGSHTAAGIHNDCLSLWRSAAPQVYIVGSVALIEGTHLLGFLSSTRRRRKDVILCL